MSVRQIIKQIDSVLESTSSSAGTNFVLLLGPPGSGKGYISSRKLQVFGIPQYLPYVVATAEDPVTREGDEELRNFQRAVAIRDFNELYVLSEDSDKFNRTLVKKYYVTRGGIKISLFSYINYKDFLSLIRLGENRDNRLKTQKYKHTQIKSLIKSLGRVKPLDPNVFERYFKLTKNYYVSMRGTTGDEGASGLETLKLAARKSFLTSVNKAIASYRPNGGGGFTSKDLIVIDTPGEDIHRVSEYQRYLQQAKSAGFGTSIVALFPGVTTSVSASASKMGNFSRSLVRGDRMVDPKTDIDGYFNSAPSALRKLASSEFLDAFIPLYNKKITSGTIELCRNLILDCLEELNRTDLVSKARKDENALFSQVVANLLYSNSHLESVTTLQKFLSDNPIFKYYEVGTF
jgi:hypothetical protein